MHLAQGALLFAASRGHAHSLNMATRSGAKPRPLARTVWRKALGRLHRQARRSGPTLMAVENQVCRAPGDKIARHFQRLDAVNDFLLTSGWKSLNPHA